MFNAVDLSLDSLKQALPHLTVADASLLTLFGDFFFFYLFISGLLLVHRRVGKPIFKSYFPSHLIGKPLTAFLFACLWVSARLA